jgi:hypothetical protein
VLTGTLYGLALSRHGEFKAARNGYREIGDVAAGREAELWTRMNDARDDTRQLVAASTVAASLTLVAAIAAGAFWLVAPPGAGAPMEVGANGLTVRF